jgi:chromosome segregation ATPase
MVQTDISQLTAETADWRQILRNYRDEFSECKRLLQDNCKHPLNKDQLQDVEHFHNQFHIQLINIHDVKQEIKNHERKVQHELSKGDSLSDQTYEDHERLLNEFLSLENTLQEVRGSFNNFINATNC